MIQADTTARKGKDGKNKRKNKKKKKSQQSRGRSNTTEETIKKPQKIKNEEDVSISVNEEYLGVQEEQTEDLLGLENSQTKDSTDKSAEIADKKGSLFISRCEDDEEESKVLKDSNKKDYDIITELESKVSLSSRGNAFEEIEAVYLGEPKWHKSSSWVKPVPHRVYKIKTVWSEVNKFDTEVRRRYRHFIWLRNMLVKESEHCAVPVLPEKTIFERVFGHESDFIKERIRKMKHFLTLVISHRKLQQSDYLKAFLCESEKIFKSTLKNLKLLEESDKSPVVQKTKGWLSVAGSAFASTISKSSGFTIENVIPGVKMLLSKSDTEYDSGDLLVKKYSEKVEVVKQSFIDLYKLTNNLHDSRAEECKIERAAYYALEDTTDYEEKAIQDRIGKQAIIAKMRGNEAAKNVSDLQEMLYATENHLVWLESVEDLINRKTTVCDKLMKIKTDMKNGPLNHHEIASCQYLLELTERRDKIIKGIRKEMEKLTIGTKDFYKRYVDSGFIVSQLNYYKISCSLYGK